MTKQSEKIKGKVLEMKEGQLVTRYIKNWADSTEIKSCSSLQTLYRFDTDMLRSAQLFIYRNRSRLDRWLTTNTRLFPSYNTFMLLNYAQNVFLAIIHCTDFSNSAILCSSHNTGIHVHANDLKITRARGFTNLAAYRIRCCGDRFSNGTRGNYY